MVCLGAGKFPLGTAFEPFVVAVSNKGRQKGSSTLLGGKHH